jgi:serine/threonine-protein kinase
MTAKYKTDNGEEYTPIPLGTVLENKYRVRRVLGRGSMGLVYLGADLALQREVAIKVLAPRYARDQRLSNRFRREAVAMASVRSEHVVQIFSYGDHEGFPYFVMEYIPGYTVANLIDSANERGEHLYFDVVLGILRQVSDGLEAVHARGIVHRDVKPANMLIGPGFRVAIADFGLVETSAGDRPERDLAGTPLYLAPELIRRLEMSSDLRSRADIYALGVSAYEMLTGDVPFDGPTVKDILRRHLEQKATPVTVFRSDLPSLIDCVIDRVLSKSPEDRYPNCTSFIDALVEARGGESIAPQRTHDLRILIAETDAQRQTEFRTALKVGFPQAAIVVVEDGLTALEMAKDSPPELMLVSMDLPGMNGLELCAALTGDELTATIPVLVVSRKAPDADARAVLKSLGVSSILWDPIEVSHLVNIARQYLERGGSHLQ